MRLKVVPAGNLFPYLTGPKDMRGDPREQPPVRLRGSAERAGQLIAAQAPDFLLETDRRRRTIRHNRRHLVHLILCFSEELDDVREVLPDAIERTEELILAGLPRSALEFVWYSHPQVENAHAHGGLVESLLPRGGFFAPRLDSGLVLEFERLASRALGLSDPLDPAFARKVLAASPSYSDANRKWTSRVFSSVDKVPNIDSHEEFLRIVRRCDLEILVSPDKKGAPQLTPDGLVRARTRRVPRYTNTVTTLTPEGKMLCFTGRLCRPGYKHTAWQAYLRRRKREFETLQEDALPLYQSFHARISERIEHHRIRYGKAADHVSLKDFTWLDPRRRRTGRPIAVSRSAAVNPQQMEDASQRLAWGPDLLNPYYLGLEPPVEDITNRINFAPAGLIDQDLDDPSFDRETWEGTLEEIFPGMLRLGPVHRRGRRRRGLMLRIGIGLERDRLLRQSVVEVRPLEAQPAPVALPGQKPAPEPSPEPELPHFLRNPLAIYPVPEEERVPEIDFARMQEEDAIWKAAFEAAGEGGDPRPFLEAALKSRINKGKPDAPPRHMAGAPGSRPGDTPLTQAASKPSGSGGIDGPGPRQSPPPVFQEEKPAVGEERRPQPATPSEEPPPAAPGHPPPDWGDIS